MEVSPLVIQLSHLNSQHIPLLILHLNLVLGHDHSVLRELISLLEVDDKLILSLDNNFVFFDLLFVHQNFVALVLPYTIHKIVEGLQLDIEIDQLIVLDGCELSELLDLFSGVGLLLLELLHHADEVAHVVTTCLFQIIDDLLCHNDFVLEIL